MDVGLYAIAYGVCIFIVKNILKFTITNTKNNYAKFYVGHMEYYANPLTKVKMKITGNFRRRNRILLTNLVY